MVDAIPLLLASKAGIKRDGTQFEGDYYVDGEWTRFQRGLPRKMGGYTRLMANLAGPPRELEIFKIGPLEYVHSGSGSKLERFTLNHNHVASVISDRTPGGFVADPMNDWTFAEVFDTAGSVMKIIAHAAPNLEDIANDVNRPIYIGDAADTAALTAVASSPTSDVSGGILAMQTYLVAYGSDGTVRWSVSNAPGDLAGVGSGAARVAEQKIVKGLMLRGGGQSPASLLWSLNALIRMSFIGGSAIWQFDTLTTENSILSPNSVIEYDGIYYWCGIDRFLMFNGILQELDNDLNLNFFYDNLTPGHAGKVFTAKMPRWGEIWFCAPMFGSEEPNHAVIYNVRESRRFGYPVWYDTPLPADGRGAAHYPLNHQHPLMTAASPVEPGGTLYALWHHEDGQPDRIEGVNVLAVRSFFETADFNNMTNSQSPSNRAIAVDCLEPDFIQSGDLTVQLIGRANARAAPVYSDPKPVAGVINLPEEQLAYFKEQARLVRFRFESNVQGGDYQMGQNLFHAKPGDARLLGAVE